MAVWIGTEEDHARQQQKAHSKISGKDSRYILESGRSASGMAEEIRIDKNTVCSWVRAYRRKNGLPSYAEEKEREDRELAAAV